VVIAAAGSGERFGSPVPKQFTMLGSLPVIQWSLNLFSSLDGIGEIVVVVPSDEASWKPWWNPPEGIRVVAGGNRRQDSVMRGIDALATSEYVLIHDAARPLTPPSLVIRVMEETLRRDAAVPVIPPMDTVKKLANPDTVKATLDRSSLAMSQTPQGYRLDLLRDVLRRAPDVTDEASALEMEGVAVAAVRGDPVNMKLTNRSDLRIMEGLAGAVTEERSGLGLDFHPFSQDRRLVLGGCVLDDENGLSGHSDGDAVLHAIADAILSAARLGDIGTFFPPSDSRWKDADSSELLRMAAAMAGDGGWVITQVDITVISVRPDIRKCREDIIESVAAILGTSTRNVWVKGTTTNSLGDIGSGKGLGCLALVRLRRPDRSGGMTEPDRK